MELIEDLSYISTLSAESLNCIFDSLNKTKLETLEEALEFERKCKELKINKPDPLRRFFLFLAENIINDRNPTLAIENLNGKMLKLIDDEKEALRGWGIVKKNINKIEAFLINRKEVSIKSKFSAIEDFEIISDVRPVFDLNRDNLEKILHPFILKIKTIDDKEFLCEFYEDMFYKIKRELEIAEEKYKKIKKYFNGKNRKYPENSSRNPRVDNKK